MTGDQTTPLVKWQPSSSDECGEWQNANTVCKYVYGMEASTDIGVDGKAKKLRFSNFNSISIGH